MIRRTLALAGAAVLVVGVSGLSGPAAADTGVNTVPQGTVHISEFGANMNDLPTGVTGDFVELHNTNTSTAFPLDDFSLMGCDSTGSFDVVGDFGPDAEIPAGGFYLIADDDYVNGSGPDRNRAFDPGADLEQIAGGVRLVDASSSPEHDAQWGSAVPVACSAFETAGVSPTDGESLNYDRPNNVWSLEDPTPTRAN